MPWRIAYVREEFLEVLAMPFEFVAFSNQDLDRFPIYRELFLQTLAMTFEFIAFSNQSLNRFPIRVHRVPVYTEVSQP